MQKVRSMSRMRRTCFWYMRNFVGSDMRRSGYSYLCHWWHKAKTSFNVPSIFWQIQPYHEHIINLAIGASRPPVLDCGTIFHPDCVDRDFPSTPLDNLWNLIYLTTEARSNSFEFIGAIQMNLSIYLANRWALSVRILCATKVNEIVHMLHHICSN